jgi:hypothetical protein
MSTIEETCPSLSASSPRRCLQEGNDVDAVNARLGTQSLGFLPESHNRGCGRNSTASVSKKKNDARAPLLPAPTRSVQGFRPKHLHATPRTSRTSLLLSTATKHHRSHLISSKKTSAAPSPLHRGTPPPRACRGHCAPAKPATHGGPPQQPETPTDQCVGPSICGLDATCAEEKLGCQSRHHRVPGAAAPACLRRRASSAAQQLAHAAALTAQNGPKSSPHSRRRRPLPCAKPQLPARVALPAAPPTPRRPPAGHRAAPRPRDFRGRRNSREEQPPCAARRRSRRRRPPAGFARRREPTAAREEEGGGGGGGPSY